MIASQSWLMDGEHFAKYNLIADLLKTAIHFSHLVSQVEGVGQLLAMITVWHLQDNLTNYLAGHIEDIVILTLCCVNLR